METMPTKQLFGIRFELSKLQFVFVISLSTASVNFAVMVEVETIPIVISDVASLLLMF